MEMNMLVTPVKQHPPTKAIASRRRGISPVLHLSAATATAPLVSPMTIRRDAVSTPPPLEDSMMKSTFSPSSGKVRRSIASPPPLRTKRCKHIVLHHGTCCDDSVTATTSHVVADHDHQEETTPSIESMLIELNSGTSMFKNDPDTAPSLNLVAEVSFHGDQEPQGDVEHQREEVPQRDEGEQGSACLSGSSGPILSLTTRVEDDDDDEELASFLPRIRLQPRPSRRHRFEPGELAAFIPIRD